ncbi:Abi family protein [Luteibacter sp.]|uniref:Abi family protein n=1 Tax=Luteibacter sp. TaxID=1886636 RepID=UPI003F7E9ABE
MRSLATIANLDFEEAEGLGVSYTKTWKSYEDQLDQLIARGLAVTDREACLRCLKRIGYYRISGYWYALRERSGPIVLLDGNGQRPARAKCTTVVLDEFKQGATFKDAADLYVFDKKLRMLVLDAIERIEVALRVDISHTLGKVDPFAYLRPDLLHSAFSESLDPETGLTRHHQWLGKHAQLIARSREEFVRHNKQKYGLPMPIWVACEVWDFGTLSTLYGGMREVEQDEICNVYGLTSGRVFASWLRALNYLRNVCAHHSRLWNRNIVDQPKFPTNAEVALIEPLRGDTHARARCFTLLLLTKHLVTIVNPSSSWSERMRTHLETFPKLNHLGLDLAGMGAPDDWQKMW